MDSNNNSLKALFYVRMIVQVVRHMSDICPTFFSLNLKSKFKGGENGNYYQGGRAG